MSKAQKKEVLSGSRPVFWADTVTSHGAMASAWEAAGTFTGLQHVLNLSAVLLGEQKAHAPLDMKEQSLQGWVVFQVPPDGLLHHGILAHQHRSLPSQGHVDLLHLFGSHIVCFHNEAFQVIIQKQRDLKEVLVELPGCPVFAGQHGGGSGIVVWGLKAMSKEDAWREQSHYNICQNGIQTNPNQHRKKMALHNYKR